MLKDRKTDCLQARPCIFQPGNVTGWGSEEVKAPAKELDSCAVCLETDDVQNRTADEHEVSTCVFSAIIRLAVSVDKIGEKKKGGGGGGEQEREVGKRKEAESKKGKEIRKKKGKIKIKVVNANKKV